MNVYDAVRTRRAVRSFRPETVPTEVLRRVLSAAGRAPSTGNMQPWNIYVLQGASLEKLKQLTTARAAAGDPGDERQFEMYPRELGSPYRERQIAAATQRYQVLGITREDHHARQEANAANFECYGAPAALLCYVHRGMGRPQWADVGMYLQTVMLLLRAEGLHSCPQMAWSVYRRSVAEVISPPEQLVLYCGMSIGYEATTDHVRSTRAPLDETVTFLN